jgi:hypothetical protein
MLHHMATILVWEVIVFSPFLVIIMALKRSLWDIILLCFLLLHHPDCCRVMYCYSTFLFHYYYYYYYYYYSTHFFPLDFPEMPRSNFMKPCRNIICHVKLCVKGLIFSKWPPFPWKRPECEKIEKHKNDHSMLLVKQKLMKLDRNNIHI